MLKQVYESAMRALIRFFNNRAVLNEEIRYLREKLEEERNKNFQLTKFILESRNQVTAEVETSESTDWKPAREFKSWETRKKELEQASYQKAQALRAEAQEALNKAKTTEQLEQELLED